MHPIRVIGIGTIYGDDQLGWRVISALETSLPHIPAISLLRSETPARDLLSYLNQAEYAILVDAIHTDLPIGQICTWSELALLPETNMSSHGISIPMLLQLAENIGQLPVKWIVCGIVVDTKNLGVNNALSPPVTQAMPALLDYIQTELQTYHLISCS